eukprot:gene13042-17478_t
MINAVLVFSLFIAFSSAFRQQSNLVSSINRKKNLKMIEFEANTYTYAGMLVATLVPSLLFVKFIGDQADASRGNLSEKTKERFKKAMMEQPGANFAVPTSEEEELKKQIAKAYMQDKDVDVAVLEEKLRKRALWRKEMMQQAKTTQFNTNVDEDGW